MPQPSSAAATASAGAARDDMSPAEARLAMMELANMVSVPMALTAVIRLGVPAAIWAGGANAPMSAAELLPSGHPDPSVLERLLRLLASRGVFSESTSASGDRRPGKTTTSTTRRFALTAVGRTLVPEGASGASYADYVLQHHQDALVAAWPRLHEAVLDPRGPEPFARANAGLPAYAYYGKDREANQVMLRAMAGVSEPFMDALLDGYAGRVPRRRHARRRRGKLRRVPRDDHAQGPHHQGRDQLRPARRRRRRAAHRRWRNAAVKPQELSPAPVSWTKRLQGEHSESTKVMYQQWFHSC